MFTFNQMKLNELFWFLNTLSAQEETMSKDDLDELFERFDELKSSIR